LTGCTPVHDLPTEKEEKDPPKPGDPEFLGPVLPEGWKPEEEERGIVNKEDKKEWENLVTEEQLGKFFEKTGHFQAKYVTDKMVEDLNRVLAKYQINTPEKISMFLANVAHESKTSLVEQSIGDLYVVDGVDYRGGGYTQLTGYKWNYKPFAEQMEKEGLVELDENGNNPIISKGGGAEYVAKYFPWESAGWHWEAEGNTLNRRIDQGASFYKVCQILNGGANYSGVPNGWDERKKFYKLAKTLFK